MNAELLCRGLLCVTVVSGMTLLVARLLFKRAPASRHAVLLFGLLGIMAWPFAVGEGYRIRIPEFRLPMPGALSFIGNLATETAHKKESVAADFPGLDFKSIANVEPPARRPDSSVVNAVAMVWLIGSGLMALRFLKNVAIAIRLKRSGSTLTDAAVIGVIEGWDHSGDRGSRLPVVHRSPLVSSPVTVGLWRPVVLVPDDLSTMLSPREICNVLVHEFAHVARRDHWVGLMQEIVAVVLWPHPLVRILSRELSKAREEVCDNHVLAVADAHAFARALINIAERAATASRSHTALTLGLFEGLRGSRKQRRLEQRIMGLMDQKRNRMKRSNKLWVGLTAAVVCAAALVVPLPNAAVALSPATASATQPGGAPAAIRQLDDALNAVGKTLDHEKMAGLFDKYTAADFTVVGGDGLAGKDDFMKLVRWQDPQDAVVGFVVDDTQIRELGDAAIETGRYVIRSSAKPAEIETRRYTAVWARRGGKWLIVHLQVSDPVTSAK